MVRILRVCLFASWYGIEMTGGAYLALRRILSSLLASISLLTISAMLLVVALLLEALLWWVATATALIWIV